MRSGAWPLGVPSCRFTVELEGFPSAARRSHATVLRPGKDRRSRPRSGLSLRGWGFDASLGLLLTESPCRVSWAFPMRSGSGAEPRPSGFGQQPPFDFREQGFVLVEQLIQRNGDGLPIH